MTNKSIFSLCVLALSLTISPLARATVIYIDFNNNPDERLQLLKSTSIKSTDAQVLLIPTENRSDALQLQKLTDERDKIWVEYTKKSCSADLACQAVPSGECHDIYLKLRSFEDSAFQAPKNMLTIDVIRSALQTLDASLKKRPALSSKITNVKSKNRDPITLILSGHFGGGVFTGNLGSLPVTDIQSVFAEFPTIQAQVTRIFMLGCYTNTLPLIKTLWRAAFPSARILAGFFSQSPRGESPENLALINTLIKNERTFDVVSSQSDFAKSLNLLKPFADLSVALCVNDFYQEVGGKLQHVSQEEQQAVSCSANLTPEGLQYFKDVQSGDAPVPDSTNNSELRSYYTSLRNHASCLNNSDFLLAEPDVPNPDQVIRLILYRTVAANFQSTQATDLANLDLILKSIGVESELLSQSVNLADRKALNAWIKALQLRMGAVADKDTASKVLTLLGGLSDTLVKLANSCVPFSWVEPGATEVSSCFRVAGQCGALPGN